MVAYAPKTPSSEVKAHRQVRLVGEIVRLPSGFELFPQYPFVRKIEGESVGFLYQVTSHGHEQRVAIYDEIQTRDAHYLLFGRVRCSCDRRKRPPRQCWHASLAWERKEKDRKGES